MIGRLLSIACLLVVAQNCCLGSSRDLDALKKDDPIAGLRVANLYSGSDGQIVGAKLWDARSGAPIYLLQIETVPQVFMWVDTPADSNTGVAHSLEHLLGGKGTKGRYASPIAARKSPAQTVTPFFCTNPTVFLTWATPSEQPHRFRARPPFPKEFPQQEFS